MNGPEAEPTPEVSAERPSIFVEESFKVSEEIQPMITQRAAEAASRLTEMAQNNDIEGAQPNWPGYAEDAQLSMAGTAEFSPAERVIYESFLGIPAEVERTARRSELSERIRTVHNPKKREALVAERNQLNVDDAAWQASCVRMIMMLENHPEQREILSSFWQALRDNMRTRFPEPVQSDYAKSRGGEQAHFIRNGILGAATTIHLFRAMGLSFALAAPEQDAIEKIDLWAWPKSEGRPSKAAAFQLKSALGLGRINLEEIRQPRTVEPKMSKKVQANLRQQTKLLESAQRYSSQLGVDVHAFWAEMTKGKTREIDTITGQPTDGYVRFHVNGRFGYNIKKALGLVSLG